MVIPRSLKRREQSLRELQSLPVVLCCDSESLLQSVECPLSQIPPLVRFPASFPRVLFFAPLRIFTQLFRRSLINAQPLRETRTS